MQTLTSRLTSGLSLDNNDAENTETETVIIKKYANRRLYDTMRSHYVTLEDVAKMVREGIDFVVYDAKSGEDITRSILTQIIFDEEGKAGEKLLPTSFLRDLIRFYGDSFQNIIPSYLDVSMAFFKQNQQRFQNVVEKAMSASSPMSHIEKITQHNKDLLEKSLSFFTPFVPSKEAACLEKENADLKKENNKLKAELQKLKGER